MVTERNKQTIPQGLHHLLLLMSKLFVTNLESVLKMLMNFFLSYRCYKDQLDLCTLRHDLCRSKKN